MLLLNTSLSLREYLKRINIKAQIGIAIIEKVFLDARNTEISIGIIIPF